MLTTTNILLLIAGYLLGSIPSAVWIGKYFYKIDVREYGSGNAGATNTFRVLGKKAGTVVLILDILKGSGAVLLAHFSNYATNSNQFINLQLVLGISSLIGHIFPLFASFRGGKGVATLLGVVLAVHPMAASCSVLVFVIILLISSYVSLGSMIAGIAFPISVIVVFQTKTPSLIIFSILIAIMILITHQKNIERLLRREESKAKIIKKKVKNKEKEKIKL